jgi:hypothetical protein
MHSTVLNRAYYIHASLAICQLLADSQVNMDSLSLILLGYLNWNHYNKLDT